MADTEKPQGAGADAKTKDPKEPKAVTPPPPQGVVSLLDAATYNLNIAQQYIDEARFPAENRLICFHYGVALLASYRDKPEMRSLAREYLETALNWQVPLSDGAAVRVYQRILAESYYNLGVIDELDGQNANALFNYGKAIQTAAEAKDKLFVGVEIMARFGAVSVRDKLLTSQGKDAGAEREQLKKEIAKLLECIRQCEQHVPLARRTPDVYVWQKDPDQPQTPPAPVKSGGQTTPAESPLLRQMAVKLDEMAKKLG